MEPLPFVTIACLLIVICGPMFSGKSTAIFRYVSRALRAHKKVMVFVPKRDTRSSGQVVTHGGQSLSSLGVKPIAIDASYEILQLLQPGTDCVVIDEAQFFDPILVDVVMELKTRSIEVVVAGLDMTSEGDTFGPMGDLTAKADRVEKITAICSCGREATRTLFRGGKTETIVVGGDDLYEATCFPCWTQRK